MYQYLIGNFCVVPMTWLGRPKHYLLFIINYSDPSLSRILDNPDKFWLPENQTQVIFTPFSRNLDDPDKKWPPEVSG